MVAASALFVQVPYSSGSALSVIFRSVSLMSNGLTSHTYLTMNPARGVKFPPHKLREAPAMIAGDDFTKLLKEVDEPYRMMIGLIAASGLRIGEPIEARWSASCSQLFAGHRKRTANRRPQLLIRTSPKKRLRLQASAGGKS